MKICETIIIGGMNSLSAGEFIRYIYPKTRSNQIKADIFEEFKERRIKYMKDLTIELRTGVSKNSLQTELDGINKDLKDKDFTEEERNDLLAVKSGIESIIIKKGE
jgi:hypothetical protein